MKTLRALTLVYTAVLVLALAASLIAILVYMLRISTRLAEAQAALETVRDQTEPLAGHLEPLQVVAAEAARDLEAAEHSLARADEHLGTVVESPAMAEPAEQR